jgi:hypothetical protein
MTSLAANEMYIDPTILQQRWSSNFNQPSVSDIIYPLIIDSTGVVLRVTQPITVSYSGPSTTSIAITANTPTILNYSTLINDPYTLYSNGVFITPSIGYYTIIFSYNITPLSTSDTISLNHNNTALVTLDFTNTHTGGSASGNFTITKNLTNTDTISLVYTSTITGSITFSQGSTFTISRI